MLRKRKGVREVQENEERRATSTRDSIGHIGSSSLSQIPHGFPLSGASTFSQLTYSWLTPVVTLGSKRLLEVSDFWVIDRKWSAAYLSSQLDASWERRESEADSFNLALAKGDVQPGFFRTLWWKARSTIYPEEYDALQKIWRNVTGVKKPSLSASLNEVAGSFFWVGGLCKVFADLCQMMGPVLIKSIINFAKARSEARALGEAEPSLFRGILLAIGLFLLAMTTSLSHHQFFWRSIVTGMLSRTALISSIYKRTITLSSKVKLSNATAISYISTDVSRVEACAQWFHPVWAAPIQVTICLTILLFQLGPSSLAGFVLFFFVIILQKRILGRQFQIRKRLGKLTELRTKSLLEAIGSMHFIKCYTLEHPFFKHISALRRAELTGVKEIQNYQSANAALAFSLPVLAATLAFATYSRSGDFDLAVVFASLSLFQLLRQPMTFWPRALSLTTDARNSLNKISAIYSAERAPSQPLTIISSQTLAVSVEQATFQWQETIKQGTSKSLKENPMNEDQFPFTLRDINMEVHRGGLVAIIGTVASGKSSFLQGLLGEMSKTSGKMSFGGSVAYCPQVPWLEKGTLRDNVLFGQPFQEARYWKVLEDVCLLDDLRELPDGDLTQVREDGVNLSGGQKQRVSLARALYLDADILLLDDPLSGVDPRVGNEIFQRAIREPVQTGRKTVILVTYTWSLLPHCDYIYSLREGRIAEKGTFEEIQAAKTIISAFTSTKPEIEPLSKSKTSSGRSSPELRAGGRYETAITLGPSEKKAGKPLQSQAYSIYFRAAKGVLTMPTVFLATILMQGSQIFSSRNLVWWQTNAFGRSFGFYQVLYGTFGLLQTLSTFFLGTTVDSISCLVSQNMHDEALQNILHAPMSFFESTPRGQILSLFGKDIDSIDNQLPSAIRTLCLTVGTVLGSTTVILLVQPYLVVVAALVFTGYQHFARVHRTTARQVKRIESTLRSNLYAHFAESLNGLPTIRSYGQVERVVDETDALLDLQNRASFIAATNQRWLSVRLDFCGAVLIFAVALCAVLEIGNIGAAKIGLILTYTTTLTQICGLLTRQIADVEIHMNSIERLSHYHNQEIQESNPTAEETQPPPSWPEHGAVSLKEVAVKYRSGRPDALHNISLNIKAGERLGIVGRTGAGKSSLVNCLMRLMEYSGTIEIDGVDISTIGLKSLRSKLSFVPQQPVVFGGTIRSALDPHGQYDDGTLRDALYRAFSQIDDQKSNSKGEDGTGAGRCLNLEAIIEPEGRNLSVGERALISLARVLVRNSRIVVLDEATASIDQETDEKVQRAIHQEFKDRTLLCIAHRIRTVLAYDKILVLDEGNIVELGKPLSLFDNEGFFHKLCSESHIKREDIVKARWTV